MVGEWMIGPWSGEKEVSLESRLARPLKYSWIHSLVLVRQFVMHVQVQSAVIEWQGFDSWPCLRFAQGWAGASLEANMMVEFVDQQTSIIPL